MTLRMPIVFAGGDRGSVLIAAGLWNLVSSTRP
jgi:hypothetical protein